MIKGVDFRTSANIPTERVDDVGAGLSSLLLSGVNLAKTISDVNKKREINEQKALEDESVLEASRMSNRYYEEYAKKNMASKTEEERLTFDEEYKANLNFDAIKDEKVRNSTKVYFNKIIASSQGELFAKQEQERALNSSVALLDETKRLEDKYYEVIQTQEGNPYLFKKFIEEEYTNNQEFEYNPLLTEKDKVKHKKIIDSMLLRVNADTVKYNQFVAKQNLELLSEENQTFIDTDKFNDIYYGLKSLDKNMTKTKVYDKLLNNGLSKLKDFYDAGGTVGKSWNDVKSQFFGSYLDDIKDAKILDKVQKVKNKINEDNNKYQQVQTLFKTFDGTSQKIDELTIKEKDGIEKVIPDSIKTQLSSQYMSSILNSNEPTDSKGVKLGKFYEKNKKYADEFIGNIAKKINSRDMNFSKDEFTLINNARYNGYIPSKDTANMLDDFEDIAFRHNMNMSNPDWVEQAKGIYNARNTRREELEIDGIKANEVKRAIKEDIDSKTSSSFFDMFLDIATSTATARLLSPFSDMPNAELHKGSLERMTYEYYLEGYDIESASKIAFKRLNDLTQGTSLPLTKMEKNEDIQTLLGDVKLNPAIKEKIIKDYIFSEFSDEVKENANSSNNISIIPADTNNIGSSGYRALVTDNNGMIINTTFLSEEYLLKAYKNGLGKKDLERKEKEEDIDKLIGVFFKKPTKDEQVAFNNTFKYGNKDDTLFGGIINEIYQNNKSSVDSYLDIIRNIPNEFREQQKEFGGKFNSALEGTLKEFFSTDTLLEASLVAPGLPQISVVEKILSRVTKARNTYVFDAVFKNKEITKAIDELNMFKTQIFEGKNIVKQDLTRVDELSNRVIKVVKDIYLNQKNKIVNNKNISIKYTQLNNISKIKDELIGFKTFKERGMLLDDAISKITSDTQRVAVNGFPNKLNLQELKRAKLINNKRIFEIGNKYKINNKVSDKDIDDIIENVSVLDSLSYDRALSTIIK